jgi:hypothetical protein
MMGSQTSGQERLFYSFNLEDHIPPNHLLRGIDRFLDLHSLRERLAHVDRQLSCSHNCPARSEHPRPRKGQRPRLDDLLVKVLFPLSACADAGA